MHITVEHKAILAGKVCPYCKQPTRYIDSIKIYKKSYGMMYICFACEAWVGVHAGTDKALGRLATKELRQLKMELHRWFDPMWVSGMMTRAEAYKKLSHWLQLPKEYTHVGMFSEATCRKAIEKLQAFYNDDAVVDNMQDFLNNNQKQQRNGSY